MKKKVIFASTLSLMLGLSVSLHSCSVDEEDDEVTVEPVVTYRTLTAVVGGARATSGSFLSIKDSKVYRMVEIKSGSFENVEIFFDGTTFKSATESPNDLVNSNGKAAVITRISDQEFAFTTSTGYSGTITVDGILGDDSASYTITVKVRENEYSTITETTDWSTATTKVTATPGTTYTLKNAGVVYSLRVVSAQAGQVVVLMNGTDVTLSDAGTSYLSIEGKGLYRADATADPSKVLICLLPGTTTLVSATEGKSLEIASGANQTLIK